MTAYAYIVRRMWKKAGNEDLVVSFHHLGQPSAHVFRFQFLQRALRLSCNEEMTESVRWLIVFDERRYSWIFTALLNLKVFFENGKFSVLFFFFLNGKEERKRKSWTTQRERTRSCLLFIVIGSVISTCMRSFSKVKYLDWNFFFTNFFQLL